MQILFYLLLCKYSIRMLLKKNVYSYSYFGEILQNFEQTPFYSLSSDPGHNTGTPLCQFADDLRQFHSRRFRANISGTLLYIITNIIKTAGPQCLPSGGIE